MGRISQAFGAFFGILFGGKLPDDLADTFGYAPKEDAKPAEPPPPPTPTFEPADGAVQMLGILQRDARLLDFLMEDISGATDDQVGAAVRELHRQARESLSRYVVVGPVIDGVEGTPTRLTSAQAADPSAIKLLGRVPATGKATAGVLRHRGWRVERVDLPRLTAGQNVAIVAPAEVEIE